MSFEEVKVRAYIYGKWKDILLKLNLSKWELEFGDRDIP